MACGSRRPRTLTRRRRPYPGRRLPQSLQQRQWHRRRPQDQTRNRLPRRQRNRRPPLTVRNVPRNDGRAADVFGVAEASVPAADVFVDNLKALSNLVYVFALIWSVGGSIAESSRERCVIAPSSCTRAPADVRPTRFSDYIRELFPQSHIPKSGTVFEVSRSASRHCCTKSVVTSGGSTLPTWSTRPGRSGRRASPSSTSAWSCPTSSSSWPPSTRSRTRPSWRCNST